MDYTFTLQEPDVEASSPNSWGYITRHFGNGGWDYHESFWFKTQSALIFWLCLATGEYPDGGRTREDVLFTTILASQRSPRDMEAALIAIEDFLDGRDLVWWGQCQDLLTGEQPFPVKLRKQYFSDRGLVNPPEYITGWEVEHFNEWLVEFDGFRKP
jgi:hypothetical protein